MTLDLKKLYCPLLIILGSDVGKLYVVYVSFSFISHPHWQGNNIAFEGKSGELRKNSSWPKFSLSSEDEPIKINFHLICSKSAEHHYNIQLAKSSEIKLYFLFSHKILFTEAFEALATDIMSILIWRGKG
jgi:hypothetical protein